MGRRRVRARSWYGRARIGLLGLLTLALSGVAGPGIAGSGTPAAAQSVGRQLVAAHSGLCLTVRGDATTAGTPIVQEPCTDRPAQSWTLTDRGDGWFELRVAHSGMCLDVAGISTADGAAIHQWPCHGGDNQQFRFAPGGPTSGDLLPRQIIARHANKCIDITGASTAAGAAAIQWPCASGARHQLFTVGAAADPNGSGEPSPAPGIYPVDATPRELNQPPDPYVGALTPAADAPERGMFGPQVAWPLIPIHAVLTASGRLITYGSPTGRAVQEGSAFDQWNPATNTNVQTPAASAYNAFCNGVAPLSSGELVMVGGNTTTQTHGFNPATSAQRRGPNLNRQRWYATALARPDGQIVVMGGADYYNTGAYLNPGNNNGVAITPEIGDGTGPWRPLTGATNLSAFGAANNRYWYPRAYNAPDGSVFGVSWDEMWRLDTAGSGSVRTLGRIPLAIGASGSSVMYDTGKLLFAGGGQAANGDRVLATKAAAMVDINGATPSVAFTGWMARERNWLNLTVMANGEVLANGGTVFGADDGGANAVRETEIWNPRTGGWRTGASAARIRTYHSVALLLPSGAVFTGGGGVPGPEANLNAEWYLPPHLFTRSANGTVTWANRPKIDTIAGSLTWGGSVNLGLTDARTITSASLISLGNVTHSLNTDQRRIPLAISQNGATVTATLPTNVNVLPPGSYLLQVVDAAGVPSPSQIVTLRTGGPGTVTVYEAGVGTGGGRAGGTVPLTVGTAVRFDPVSFPGLSVSHKDGRVRIERISVNGSEPNRRAATWIVRPGLASPQGISLESASSPGHFLRVEANAEAWLRPDDGTAAFAADATFRPVTGLTGEYTSLQLWRDPARFLRHANFVMRADPFNGTAVARLDMTFAVRAGFVDPPVPVPGSLTGTITNGDGSPAAGVVVDLFAALSDGSRGAYLSSTTTDAAGTWRFPDLTAGCYTTTAIAPDGRTFTSGQTWANDAPCVTAGRDTAVAAVRLAGGGAAGASVSGIVADQGGNPAAGVSVDLFQSLADGSRGAYLRSTTTGPDGAYRFDIDAGCHTVTVIAPEGRSFVDGATWANRSGCPTPGQSLTGLDAQLIGGTGGTAITGSVVDPADDPAAGIAVDLFTTLADGSRGTYLRSTVTDAAGTYRFDTAPGCHTVTLIAPDGAAFADGNTWLNLTACPAAGDVAVNPVGRLN